MPSASRPSGAVEELDDLEDGDLVGRAGEGVAALDAALGAQDAGAAQGGEELLEELHRDVAAAGELADRDGGAVARAAELGQRLERVGGFRGDRDHRSLRVRWPGRSYATALPLPSLLDGASSVGLSATPDLNSGPRRRRRRWLRKLAARRRSTRLLWLSSSRRALGGRDAPAAALALAYAVADEVHPVLRRRPRLARPSTSLIDAAGIALGVAARTPPRSRAGRRPERAARASRARWR